MNTTNPAPLQVIRLRAKLTNAAASVKGLFGVKSEKDSAVQKLEALKVRTRRRVSSVLRDAAVKRICRSPATSHVTDTYC